MSESMNLSVNGQSQVPPGFRFHPTEEELLQYYLRKKVAYEKIDLDVIRDVDLNKLEPWDIQEKCKIGSTPQNDWYFFSHKDKKYPTGTRTNRATAAGFWKATGRDKVIHSNCKRIGMRKTLVFYRGRAPHGQKSDWIMHEYRLDDNSNHAPNIGTGDTGPEEGWVVCRVFKKKNYHKTSSDLHPTASSRNNNDNILDQILMYIGRSSSTSTFKQEDHEEFPNTAPDFAHLPALEIPAVKSSVNDIVTEIGPSNPEPSCDWVALERLVASQLNGSETVNNHDDFSFSFDDHDDQMQLLNMPHGPGRPNADTDFWSFARTSSSTLSLSSSSSDPLSHLSV